MDITELKSLDTFGAFSDFISVKDSKTRNLIPEDIQSCFPDKCKCGSDMIINESLKSMLCCDPLCYIKQGYSLAEFLKRGGIKGLGPAYCLDTMFHYMKRNPGKSYLYMIYSDLNTIHSYGSEGLEIEDAIKYIVSQPRTFSTIVGSLGLPKLSKRAVEILRGINTSDELLKLISSEFDNSIDNFLEYFGVSDTMFKFYFKFYLKDLVYVQDVYKNMIRSADKNIKICITGKLYPNGVGVTREEFLDLCNATATAKDGRRLFEIQDSSAIKSVNYLVCDSDTASTKYLISADREIAEKRKIIYTSDEFLGLIEREVQVYDGV